MSSNISNCIIDYSRGPMDARRLPFITNQENGVLIAGGVVFHPGIAIHLGNSQHHLTVHGVHFISGLPRWWELRAWWDLLQTVRAALAPINPPPKTPVAPAAAITIQPTPVLRKRYKVETRDSHVTLTSERRVVSPHFTGPWVTGNTAAAWKAYKQARKADDQEWVDRYLRAYKKAA